MSKATLDTTKKNGGLSEDDMRRRKRHTIIALIFFLLTIIFGLALFRQAGIAGDTLLNVMKLVFGSGRYGLPLVFLIFGIILLRHREERMRIDKTIALVLMTLTLLGILSTIQHIFATFGGGGFVGYVVSTALIRLFNTGIAVVILFVIFLASTVVMFHWTLRIPDFSFTEFLSSILSLFISSSSQSIRVSGMTDDSLEDAEKISGEELNKDDTDKETKVSEMTSTPKSKVEEKINETANMISAVNKLPSTYTPPILSLLSRTRGNSSTTNIQEMAEIIQKTLANFNIEVVMDEIIIGPSVTRYAMRPALGTKLSRIKGLENELSLALAAHPIRIEAPIPGKSLVGIEIPNQEKSLIGLGSMLDEDEFRNTNKSLLVSIGKGVSGKAHFDDITKMPHILIAGATGSGKSVMVHNLILSLIFAHGPEYVRFILVDPKRVELTLYDGIPHLLTPVIKEAKKAILAFKWAANEMSNRYEILEQNNVRDISSYHKTIVEPAYTEATKNGMSHEDTLPDRMPYIMIIIDELADLMQLYPRELESSVVRLAQMSRAVGIHLVLSTQRPSVNVITGLIKANIPARAALKVASQIDSRTILDTPGAESLLGRGDLLYRNGTMSEPERIQCAYVPEDEIKSVVKYIVKHNRTEFVDGIDIPDTIDDDRSIVSGTFDSSDNDDAIFEDVRMMVIRSGKASTSYIQRKFRIGYSRAARLMDMLEEAGIIGPGQGSKPRDVLIKSTDAMGGVDFSSSVEDTGGNSSIDTSDDDDNLV